MKLLFVHQNFGAFGGAEAYLELAGKGLTEAGHQVGLVYESKTGHNEAAWQDLFAHSFSLNPTAGPQSLSPILRKFSPDLFFIHNWTNLDFLQQILDSGVPAVRMVHDHSSYCLRTYKYNYFSRKICTRAASAYCVFPCLGPLQRDRSTALGIRWASYFNKLREIELNRGCAAVLVYSEYQKAELTRNGFEPAKIFIQQLLREANPQDLISSFSKENLILFAGQLIRGKGVDALLRALVQVRVPFRCVILGDGSHRAACQRLSARLGLSQCVRFLGYVPPGQSEQYYLRASVFAMSSLWPEPFGMAGPEAMRYGVPVVAFDAGAISEWLHDGKNGFLVPWNDTRSYARALERLLTDKTLARQMGLWAQSYVRRFDVSRQMPSLERLLTQFSRKTHLAKPPAEKVANPVSL